MEKYFVLYSCCIPVKGAARSTICDIHRSGFIFIPNEFYDLLKQNENKISYEYYSDKNFPFKNLIKDLISDEYGFLCDNPEEFPPIDTTFEKPNIISNITIDLGKEKTFDFERLVLKLNEVTCFSAYIRLFNENNIASEILKILPYFNNSTIRSIEIEIMKPGNERINKSKLLKINEKYPNLRRVIVRNQKVNKMEKFNNFEYVFLKNSTKSTIKGNECGLVSPYNFRPNYDMFFESLKFNNCLNGKLSIDINGHIRNCPFHTKKFKHIDKIESLKDFVSENKQFRFLWNINKDKIEVCKDCEFRYICQDCRVYIKDKRNIYSKPKHCKYNPYKAVWEK